MSGEPDIMHEKYQIRGAADDSTVTLETVNARGIKICKPATPAEEHLVRQVSSLISALRVALRRNAEYELRHGMMAQEKKGARL